MRRVTILATVAVVGLSLIIGFYILLSSTSAIDPYIGQPVPSSTYNALYATSGLPYGDLGTFAARVQSYSGQQFNVGGKPLVLYVGAEFCEFCAVQRWSIVLALMRFGNFTGLQYMASAAGSEGDLPTFTFAGSSYHSNYVAFQGFEIEDRDGKQLETLPANYSTSFQASGSTFPFMNFGGRYLILGALPDPSAISSKNWTQVISSIHSSDNAGIQIRRAANVMTGVICKLTNDNPSSVCNTYPIQTVVIGLAGPSDVGLAVSTTAYPPPSRRG